LRIGIESKKANYINAGHSLGKGEVVSSILTGSTRFLSSSTTIRNALALIAATFAAMMI